MANRRYGHPVQTVGIDMAADPRRTAVARVQWSAGRALLTRLQTSATDDAVLASLQGADCVGIDVPFGWPEDFQTALARHREGQPWPNIPRVRLRYRETDHRVHAVTGRWPLSVSTDRIGVTALRMAALASRLGDRGEPVARDGSGRLVEVYPVAALRMWGFDVTGYKGKRNRAGRERLFATIRQRTAGWLEIDGAACTSCCANDDALDAVVAAMVARAAALGFCERPPEDVKDLAKREGWILLPTLGSLDNLSPPA